MDFNAINKIKKGVATSVIPNELPEGSVRELNNGYILSYKENVFTFRKGKSYIQFEDIGTLYNMIGGGWDFVSVYGFCPVKKGIFIAALKSNGDTFLGVLTISENFEQTSIGSIFYSGTGISLTKIIMAESYYESEEIESVYWLEKDKPLASINIRKTIYPQLKYLYNNRTYKYGNITFQKYVSGTLKSGNYFYAYRCKSTDGRSITPWSLVNGPVMPRNKKVPNNWGIHDMKPQEYFALKPESETECGHHLVIENIDTDYDKVEVVALYQTVNGEIQEAEVFFSGNIYAPSGSMNIYHTSNGIGYIVSVESILDPGLTILSAKSFTLTNKMNVMAGYTKNPELPETDIIKLNKWEGATVSTVSDVKIPLAGNFEEQNEYRFTNEYLQPLPGGFETSGAKKSNTLIYLNKYYDRLVSGIKQTDAFTISNDWANYKGGIYSSMFRYFRNNETYRIGILPVDNYGNRLGVRWIKDHKIEVTSDNIVISKYESGAWSEISTLDKTEEDLIYYPEVEISSGPSSRGNYYQTITEGSINCPPWSIPSWVTNPANAIKLPFKVEAVLNYLEINNINISDLVTTDISGNPVSCLIQGFHIVIANRDKFYEDPFLIWPVIKQENINVDNDPYANDLNFNLCNPGINFNANGTQKNKAFTIYSPGLNSDSILENKTIAIQKRMARIATIDEPYLRKNYMLDYFYQGKFWDLFGEGANRYPNPLFDTTGDHINSEKALRGASIISLIASENLLSEEILRYVEEAKVLPKTNNANSLMDQGIYVEKLGIIVNNGFITYTDLAAGLSGHRHQYRFGLSPETILVVCDTNIDKDITEWPSESYSLTNHIFLAAIKNNKEVFYGGNSDEALAKTEYRSTWHYQPITLDILNAIKKPDGSFVFDNIEIRGGDTTIGLWSFSKTIRSELQYHAGKTNSWDDWNTKIPRSENEVTSQEVEEYIHDAWSLMFPLESERNIAFEINNNYKKEGHKIHHDFYEEDSNDESGTLETFSNLGYGYLSHLLYESSVYIKYSETNYTDFLIDNSGVGLSYYSLPSAFINNNKLYNGFIWSEFKYANEPYDSFKSFPSLNTLEVDGSNGTVNRIAAKNQRLYYWQDKAIGYIPVKEKAFIKDESGDAIGTGTSESMAQFYDQIIGKGIYYPNPFLKFENGFTWYDHLNESWYLMAEGFQLIDILKETNNSELKDRFLFNEELKFYPEKIKLLHDPDIDTIYLSVQGAGTLGYNYTLKELVYIGDDEINDGFTFMHKAFVWPYVEQSGESFIRFVVNKQPDIYKIFENIGVLMKSGTVSKIRYHNDEFDITEEITGSDYYRIIKNSLYGSIPQSINGEYVRGYYLYVDIFIEDNSELINLSTKFIGDWS